MSELDPIVFCREMVREDDRERYDCALFAPSDVQPRLWALYAFNQEIAKTRENVSEEALGQIRLQWWRDVVQELREDKTRDHPVVQAMSGELRNPVILDILDRLIDAREQDLYDDGPADFDALLSYADGVGGLVSEAALRLSLKSEATEPLVAGAHSVGKAWAMLGLVRAIPFHWASNRNYLPDEKGKASLATTDADKMFELAAPSIEKMLNFVSAELGKLASASMNVPRSARHVFLPLALMEANVSALHQCGNNPFKVQEIGELSRLWKLTKASLLKSLDDLV